MGWDNTVQYLQSLGGNWSTLDEASCTVRDDEGWYLCSIQAEVLKGSKSVKGTLTWTAGMSHGKISGWKDQITFNPFGGVERVEPPKRDVATMQGRVVLVRRPYQQVILRTKLRFLQTRYDWSSYAEGSVFVWGVR